MALEHVRQSRLDYGTYETVNAKLWPNLVKVFTLGSEAAIWVLLLYPLSPSSQGRDMRWRGLREVGGGGGGGGSRE